MTEREKLIEAMAREIAGIGQGVEERGLSETARRMLIVGRDHARRALAAMVTASPYRREGE